MTWMKFFHGFQLDPIAKIPPEALVVLVNDIDISVETLFPIAERWATTVPTTSFIVLDESGQPELISIHFSPQTLLAPNANAEVMVLDRATQQLKLLLEQQLRSCGLDASQLVLAGFGYGGTIALHLLLHKGWGCAGVLTFASNLMLPLPKNLIVNSKVRLIECMDGHNSGHNNLPDIMASLSEHGIDARRALLNSPVLSDEGIRHRGSYLVELVATAQRGNRFDSVH